MYSTVRGTLNDAVDAQVMMYSWRLVPYSTSTTSGAPLVEVLVLGSDADATPKLQ
jgi:hypothetical protein